jgi:hypothetical protein
MVTAWGRCRRLHGLEKLNFVGSIAIAQLPRFYFYEPTSSEAPDDRTPTFRQKPGTRSAHVPKTAVTYQIKWLGKGHISNLYHRSFFASFGSSCGGNHVTG